MEIHPESGGPHSVPVDSLQCLGMDDAPMSEFWARAPTHRVADSDRFFIKQPASAAHTYGRQFVLGEGFTDIGLHWQETLWDNLQARLRPRRGRRLEPAGVACLRLLASRDGPARHNSTSPAHISIPIQPGGRFPVRFSRTSTARQFLLQQGLFVADACQYYGDEVPNFTQLQADRYRAEACSVRLRCRHRRSRASPACRRATGTSGCRTE